MNPGRSVALLVVGLGVGFPVGWWLKGSAADSSPTADNPESSFYSSMRTPASDPDPSRFSRGPTRSVRALATRHADDLQALKDLSDDEFARRMVDVWSGRDTPENLLHKALFAEACDSEKAMAFYEAFKSRKGLTHREDGGSQLWDFMFQAGRRFGGDFVLKLTESHPEGILELDTIVHGWIASDATEAVEWLNALPEDCPYYSQALKGIVWGIGETAPDFAVRTFMSLPEEERSNKFESLGGGAVNGRGMDGLVEIAAQFPEVSDRERLLMSSLIHSMRQPPADFVVSMASQLPSVPRLSEAYQEMSGRWVRSSPVEAIAWMENHADRADQATALGLMAGQLSEAGHAAALESWLAEHPDSPARAAVAGVLESGKVR